MSPAPTMQEYQNVINKVGIGRITDLVRVHILVQSRIKAASEPVTPIAALLAGATMKAMVVGELELTLRECDLLHSLVCSLAGE